MTVPGPDDPRPPAAAEAGPAAVYDEPASPAAFSRWLRQERELRDLSRADVSRATKLAPTMVDALESGDPARMPARGYIYGYLRTYAGALGLDPDEVVLRWQEVEAAEPSPEPEPAQSRPRVVLGTGSRLPLVAAAGALAALAAAAAAWLLG